MKLSTLIERLQKSRGWLSDGLGRMVGRTPEAPVDLAAVEALLLGADLGVSIVDPMMESVRASLDRAPVRGEAARERIRELVRGALLDRLRPCQVALDVSAAKPFVIVLLGVNGSGKTTTAAKLAERYRGEGRRVILGAADTFRAAAVEQLQIWGARLGVDVIAHPAGSGSGSKGGADPAAVAFDTVQAAIARGADVVCLDTAGRLHTKSNLMEELKKVVRVVGKALPGAPHERLLVLDATVGQNGLAQAKHFHEAVGVTGLVVTKLDGTAKGGILAAIARDLKVPIRFIGIGESADDLIEFNAEQFVEALLGSPRQARPD
ncbi:MAG TPA: signal recognition particle-docking protein FtsY [Nitrospiria bacterium]|nr:signal recognition particle-docking protein FtsY [Nitrospiria bacterium]